MAQLLDATAVATALAGLTGWTGDTAGISRTARLADFPTAIRAVDRVAEVAEQHNHHPDIDIRWRTVTFRCSTHSAGGVTDADIALAGHIDRIIAGITAEA